MRNNTVKIFISYSRRDEDRAKRLYADLSSFQGLEPWIDTEDILPGMKWRPAIRKAIREADYFLALISERSMAGKGYRHTELYEALEIYKEYPPDQVYLIPARLDPCDVPYDELKEINWIDLFPEWDHAVQKLVRSFTNNKTPKRKIAPVKERKAVESYRVALVDLDLGLTNLESIATRLNDVQSFFHFTSPKLPALGKSVMARFDGDRNLAVYKIPAAYIKDSRLPVDFVACFTRHLLAFREKDRIVYNYLAGTSHLDERFMFFSACGLLEFSRNAKRTFDYGLIFLLTGELVDYFTKTDYHPDTRGCVMDFCEEHEDIVQGLKKGRFCSSCLRILKPLELRTAMQAILSSRF